MELLRMGGVFAVLHPQSDRQSDCPAATIQMQGFFILRKVVNMKKIDELKKEFGLTSEALFDLPEQPIEQCPKIDEYIRLCRDVEKALSNIQKEHEVEECHSRASDAEWDISQMQDNLEELRKTITAIRSWGQSWKDLAKRMIEGNDFDFEYYLTEVAQKEIA